METQKIIHLLEDNDIESQKFTKKWYIINDQTSGGDNPYGLGNDNQSIKFDTKVIKSNLCDYSDAYILVTLHIQNKVVAPAAGALKYVAFKNGAPFRTYIANINDEFFEKTENIDLISPMYILL